MWRVLTIFTFSAMPLFLFGGFDEASAQTKYDNMELVGDVKALKDATEEADATASAMIEPSPIPTIRPDFTQITEETRSPFEEILEEQDLGAVWPLNPVKYAIRGSVGAGVAPNTIVLLLLLPVIAALIAAARHIVGLRGFGIFLPAALSVVFLAIGPVIGLAFFVVMVLISTYTRLFLRKTKLKLQYLPRMSLILWAVVVGVLWILFLAPVIDRPDFTNISIFPVLILVLLAEDFSKISLGKSPRTAISQATETILLSLISFIFLTMEPLQRYALLHPEALLVMVAIFNILVGKYVGLRFLEYWRFRKLIRS